MTSAVGGRGTPRARGGGGMRGTAILALLGAVRAAGEAVTVNLAEGPSPMQLDVGQRSVTFECTVGEDYPVPSLPPPLARGIPP